MIVSIVRHGEASAFLPGVVDASRTLTEAGIDEVVLMAQHLLQLGEGADLILASPYHRARQTAELFAREWQVKAPLLSDLCLIPSGDVAFARELIMAQNVERLLVVSHMPLVSQLTNALAPDAGGVSFSTASLAKIEMSGDYGKLLSFTAPKDIIDHE